MEYGQSLLGGSSHGSVLGNHRGDRVSRFNWWSVTKSMASEPPELDPVISLGWFNLKLMSSCWRMAKLQWLSSNVLRDQIPDGITAKTKKESHTSLNLSCMIIIHPGCLAYMFLLVASQAKGGGMVGEQSWCLALDGLTDAQKWIGLRDFFYRKPWVCTIKYRASCELKSLPQTDASAFFSCEVNIPTGSRRWTNMTYSRWCPCRTDS